MISFPNSGRAFPGKRTPREKDSPPLLPSLTLTWDAAFSQWAPACSEVGCCKSPLHKERIFPVELHCWRNQGT